MTLKNDTPARATRDTLAPLRGVSVVEFCHVAAGPFCGMLLADFGARVVKVEPPDGDAMRQWPPITQGYSENFASINRGKQSVVLNLKDPAQRDIGRRLVLAADVLVENSRPGVMGRLGLGWDWFSQRKPSLVYCSISAFGQGGPRSGEGGFDLTIQAAAGVMSVTGEPDGPPVKAGVPLVDFSAGLYAAYAISAMLTRVRAGGPGGCIDVPMFSATIAVSALQASEYFGTGRNPRKWGSAHPRNAPYQAYQASDGWFAIAAGNQKLWLSVCEVTSAPHLRDDPLFATTEARAANQVALKAQLDPIFCARTLAHWLAAFPAAGVPCAPINGYEQALDDPQSRFLELVQPMCLPNGVQTRTVGCPVRFDGCTVPVDSRPPALGEHTAALLAELAESPASCAPAAPGSSADSLAPLREFVRTMTELVTSETQEAILLERARVALATLITTDQWLPADCAEPGPETYRQYLLYGDPLDRFSVVSFVWGPRQRTPVHDHTIWGLIGTLRGEEICREFRVDASGGIQPTGQVHRMSVGMIDAVSPARGDWHQVENAMEDRPSISIHVYGGNIGTVHRHMLDSGTGQVTTFVSGYSNDQMPNLWKNAA